MRWLRVLLGSVFAVGCGPIEAPHGLVDLRADPKPVSPTYTPGRDEVHRDSAIVRP